MSRVGKKPIPIPDKTKVEISGSHVKVTGPKGTLERDINPEIAVVVENNEVVVTRSTDLKKHRALHGLVRSLINNMVEGVTNGFEIKLEYIGVGYRAEIKGNYMQMAMGYSHPILVFPPEGIELDVPAKDNKIIVRGIDKELVGQMAAKIRSFRKPEPYKGKGIRYVGEQVRSKAGKTAG